MSSSLKFNDSILPPDSLVLVTGCNGLVGSHVTNEFLAAGFRVCGTVRDVEKYAWMIDFFTQIYGPDRLTLVAVPDLTSQIAFKEAIKGVHAVAHTASSVDFLNINIPDSVRAQEICLEAAASEPTVKSFVLTGSAWAVALPATDVERSFDTWQFNEDVVEAVKDPQQAASNPTLTYTACKVECEKASWAWVKKHHPSFHFNVVLLDTVFGRVLNPEKQGIPSTTGFVQSVVTAGEQAEWVVANVTPQWFVDTKDSGRLHVAAVASGINNQRLFGFAERWNWDQVLDISRKYYPSQTKSGSFGLGHDKTEVPNAPAEELLKSVYGGAGWTTLEESIKNNVASFIPVN